MGDERFIADTMLGKLAKWLRVLGIDVLYNPDAPDSELLRRAEEEERILLTRDRRLIQRRGTTGRLFIESDHYHEQVRQVVQTFGLERSLQPCTRCLRCNTPLHDLPKPAVAGRVPAYVYATQMTFKCCPACSRVYWSGTHRAHMFQQLRLILDKSRSTSPELPESGGDDPCVTIDRRCPPGAGA